MPRKNEIWSSRIAYLARHAAQAGTITGPVTTDGEGAPAQARHGRARDRRPPCAFKSSGAELVMGSGNFVAPKTLDVQLNDGGTRRLAGHKVFINVGSHAAMPSMPTPLARDGEYWRQI
jgi:pyruvate/2-oxoglutarate dehydrogenase complex dihydrolipoamide dehydrogenase (E3) component